MSEGFEFTPIPNNRDEERRRKRFAAVMRLFTSRVSVAGVRKFLSVGEYEAIGWVHGWKDVPPEVWRRIRDMAAAKRQGIELTEYADRLGAFVDAVDRDCPDPADPIDYGTPDV